jgi:hypothetical protein
MRAWASLVALMAAATPRLGAAQPDVVPVAARQDELIAQVTEEQSRSGLNSEALIGPLKALALFYVEQEDHALAIATLERTRQVVRANQGLFSLEEALLLQQMARSEEARGNVEAAWRLEQDLLALARRFPGDIATVSIYRQLAQSRLDMLGRYLAGEYPPQIVLGCYYNTGRRFYNPLTDANLSCRAGDRLAAIRSIKREASGYYRNAIEIVIRERAYSSDEVRMFAAELLGSSYRFGLNPDVGRVLQRSLAFEERNPPSPLQRADSLILIADWNFLLLRTEFDPAFEQRPSRRFRPRPPPRGDEIAEYAAVRAQYEQAYAVLEKAGIAQAAIEEVFAPRVPTVLPTFIPSPLATEAASASRGYIDVAFDINGYGEGRDIEILDATNASRAAVRELVRRIERSSFRPRVIDGRIADRSRVVVRHYLGAGS